MKRYICGVVLAASLASLAEAQAIGLNFCDGWPLPMLAGKTADGFSEWVDSDTIVTDTANTAPTGTTTLAGGLVTATWYSANTWAGGIEDDSEQQLYRVYLDDGDGGTSYQEGDGIGLSVTLTGLNAWLSSVGESSYLCRFYRSTDNGDSFLPVDILQGDPMGGALTSLIAMETVSTPTSSGDGGFPTATTGSSIRAIYDSVIPLSEDAITIAIPARNDQIRGTLAALKLYVPGDASHAGDANRDGKVDDLDASILAANWQRTGDATWETADFNADSAVNDLDASILAANWQYGVGSAVPEPGTLALLAAMAVTGALLRWRKAA